jgi:hypothetical protein
MMESFTRFSTYEPNDIVVADTIVSQAKMNFALANVPTDLSPESLALYNLIEGCANDVNGATFREEMTCVVAGYENIPGKLGYDAKDLKKKRFVEIKPKNFHESEPKRKLNGGGNFTDFTWARDKKYSDDDVVMCVSGFCHGQLVYVVEFDYNAKDFRHKIRNTVRRSLPDGDVKGRYCRTVGFSYLDWKQSSPVVVWSSPNFDAFRNTMSEPFYSYFKTELLHEEVPKTAKQIAGAKKRAEQNHIKMIRREKRRELSAKKKAINKMPRSELLLQVTQYELNVDNLPKTKKGEYLVGPLRKLIKEYITLM